MSDEKIDVKTAVKRALAFVQEVYEGSQLKRMALEEVCLSEDEQYWLVTVGVEALGGYEQVHERPSSSPYNPGNRTSLQRVPRDLKLVKINAVTGEPLPEIRDRELSPP